MSVREVAAATGLSVATVSRALRDDPKVSAMTRERVHAAARELGYSHNPYVGQMMSSLRRRHGGTFRGNMALVWKNVHPGFALDVRFQRVFDGIRARAAELGYCLNEFDLAVNKPESLRRILVSRGIRGVLIFMPSFAGQKGRFRMKLDQFACVSSGWGLWLPQLDTVRVDYFEMFRLALHHTHRQFEKGITAIWDFRTDRAAHNAGKASFITHHPAGPAAANELFLSSQELSEPSFAKIVKKHGVRCVLLGSSVQPPEWLETYVPAKHWVWFRDPGEVDHFGRVDPQNYLTGQWSVNLLASKIQMNDFGIPEHCQKVLVPPRWIPAR